MCACAHTQHVYIDITAGSQMRLEIHTEKETQYNKCTAKKGIFLPQFHAVLVIQRRTLVFLGKIAVTNSKVAKTSASLAQFNFSTNCK